MDAKTFVNQLVTSRNENTCICSVYVFLQQGYPEDIVNIMIIWEIY